jgi:hypothetical protein
LGIPTILLQSSQSIWYEFYELTKVFSLRFIFQDQNLFTRIRLKKSKYSESEGKIYNTDYCSVIDNIRNSFQTVLEVHSGMDNISVFATGNWKKGMNAKLVASIYTGNKLVFPFLYGTYLIFIELLWLTDKEVAGSCDNCPPESFCCGHSGGSSCPSIKKANYDLQYEGELMFRCIPTSTRSEDSLECNGHPNCGFYCNADESREHCNDDDVVQSCLGGNCSKEIYTREYHVES